MNRYTTARGAFTAVRRHPARTAAVCVPVLAASIFYGSTMASARPDPDARGLLGRPARGAGPARDAVRQRPADADGQAQRPRAEWHVTGCDSDYGAANQCVPWTIPGSTSQAKCAWLKSNGFGPLQVVGTNRQHLAENAQGYVCASGA